MLAADDRNNRLAIEDDALVLLNDATCVVDNRAYRPNEAIDVQTRMCHITRPAGKYPLLTVVDLHSKAKRYYFFRRKRGWYRMVPRVCSLPMEIAEMADAFLTWTVGLTLAVYYFADAHPSTSFMVAISLQLLYVVLAVEWVPKVPKDALGP
jgi:hypothetical protein